jgi:hypothetical protein
LLKENQLHLFPKIESNLNNYFLESEEKIKKWQLLYAEGILQMDEIEWLLESQKELITLEVLQNIGVSQLKINSIKTSVLKIILKAIILRV